MKRILLASAMFSMCAYNAMANDCCADNGDERADLTGFLLSLGGVLDIDKYDADIDVAAKYGGATGTRYVKLKDQSVGKAAFNEGYDTLISDFKNGATEVSDDVESKDTFLVVNNKELVESGTKIENMNGASYTTYFQRYVKAKKNKTVAGGELKGSAFYNVENGLVVGFDLGLAFTGKGKKRVDVNTKFNKNTVNPGILYFTADAKYLTDHSVTNDTDGKGGLVPIPSADTEVPAIAEGAQTYFVYIAGNTAAAAKDGLNEGAHETSGVEYAAVVTPTSDIDGKIGSLEFEKDPFSPTAAFLVGGYFKGFFGALRLGINYMTGKVKGLQNAEGAAMTYADGSKINLDHKIHQISPVLGVQFMKHIKKGVFVYATYDHMFGARKSYLVNSPVKNFKRRQHRISLGLAYHIAQ